MTRLLGSLMLLCVFLWTCASAVAQPCEDPKPVAPGRFPNPKSWGTDSGVVISTFLDLKGVDGKLVNVSHGVDLYHGNTVVFDALVQCGTEFAFVKLDNAFSSNSGELQKRNVAVVPYFYLGVPTEIKNEPERFASQKLELDPELVSEAQSLGRSKAEEFITLYRNHFGQPGPLVRLQGIVGRIFAVDVEEYIDIDQVRAHHVKIGKPMPKVDARQRRFYGAFYAALLAEWVKTVREKVPDTVIIFYTFTSMYTDYLSSLYTRPEDNGVLQNLPIWLASTVSSGGEPDVSGDLEIQRICLSGGGGNRCIAQQYTHRGLLGVPIARTKKGPPLHIDLDRFFRVVLKRNNFGIQYVRE